jgi:hypothetical protein
VSTKVKHGEIYRQFFVAQPLLAARFLLKEKVDLTRRVQAIARRNSEMI